MEEVPHSTAAGPVYPLWPLRGGALFQTNRLSAHRLLDWHDAAACLLLPILQFLPENVQQQQQQQKQRKGSSAAAAAGEKVGVVLFKSTLRGHLHLLVFVSSTTFLKQI